MNIIWEDLKFFLTSLKNLPVSESLILDDNKGFCVSTGCSLESWVFHPGHLRDSDIVKEILIFFSSRKISFFFPVYDANVKSEKILGDCGLFCREIYTAMSFEAEKISSPEENSSIKFKHVTSSEISREWAETSWRGFGGFGDVGKNYYRFIEALSNDRRNLSLYVAEYNSKNSGTFIITHEEKHTGVYYFADERDMQIITFKKIVLQATQTGLPFYKKFWLQRTFQNTGILR